MGSELYDFEYPSTLSHYIILNKLINFKTKYLECYVARRDLIIFKITASFKIVPVAELREEYQILTLNSTVCSVNPFLPRVFWWVLFCFAFSCFNIISPNDSVLFSKISNYKNILYIIVMTEQFFSTCLPCGYSSLLRYLRISI